MPRAPKPITIDRFTGLDQRRLLSHSDQKSWRTMTNLSLTLGKGVETRPGSRTVATTSSNTVGLLATKAGRYAIAPAGRDIVSDTPELRLLYLGGGPGSAAPAIGYYTELLDSELYEAPGGGASYPYVAVRTSTGDVEHHYGDVTPLTPSDPVSTYVSLPFTPSEGLLKLDSRLVAPSNNTGNLYFNSIQGGARDWTTSGDSGFIPVSKAAPGSRDVIGLSYFRQYAAVFFADSAQLWAFDENPDNITRVENFGGLGTEYRRALVNVLGDTFYLGRGGVRRLASAAVTGEREEVNIGAKVEDLTAALTASGETPIAEWIASRSQYVIAFGNKVLAITYSPSDRKENRVEGWGYWEFPFEITDVIDYQGKINFRTSDHRIVELSEEYEDDDGAPIAFAGKTQFLAKRAVPYAYEFAELALGMQGAAEVFAYPDERDPEWGFSLGVWEGFTSPYQPLYLGVQAASVAIGFEGSGRWQLDAITLSLAPMEV